MRSQFRYTSKLPYQHLSQLQELMFFNRNQSRFREAIIASIEQFGEPTINSERGFLRVHTSRLGEVQALFAVEGSEQEARPVGVAIYARTADDTITLLHVSVDQEFASDGLRGGAMLTMNLFQRLIKVGRQVKGIRKLVVLYGQSRHTEIPIHR